MSDSVTLRFSRKKWQLTKDGVTVATFINAAAGRSLAVVAAIDAAKMWLYDGVELVGPAAEINKLLQWWPGIPASATDTYIPLK